MEIRILPAAKARIIEIWNYTEVTWDEEQADKYVRDLIKAIGQHAKNRTRWKPVSDPLLEGVFFFKHARHFIFFKQLADGAVGVISILHESMDIPTRLRDDQT